MHVSSITSNQSPVNTIPGLPASSDHTASFLEVLGRVLNRADIASTSSHIQAITGMQQAVERGETFSPRDLILFQVMASRIHLRVELVSKSAETVHATVRRFQQG